MMVPSAEDTILAKLEWARRQGGEYPLTAYDGKAQTWTVSLARGAGRGVRGPLPGTGRLDVGNQRRSAMATYLVLWKFSGGGAGADREPVLKAIAGGAPDSHKLMAKHGGRLVEVYLTMGRYDGAAIVEFPDDAACARAMLEWRAFGGTTETLRAFPEGEWPAVAGRAGRARKAPAKTRK